ncbi:hypothetical protein ABIE83_008129 [Bradyrhizobium diazoefficiens]
MNQAEAKFGASSIACSRRSRGGRQIALELEVARELETAVGHEIAGGQKQAERHWEPGSEAGGDSKMR